jgi:hypothetical protein
MFKVQVFDDSPDIQRWRDVSLWIDEYYGYTYRWLEELQDWELPTAFHYGHNGRGESAPGTLADAFEVADLIWFHSDGKVRTGIRDLRTNELIYDSAAPTDIREHPEFPIMGDARWVDRFCKIASKVSPKAEPQEMVTFAQSLYEAHKHFDPDVVVWAVVMKERFPLPWPRRQPSAVQRGVEPGT